MDNLTPPGHSGQTLTTLKILSWVLRLLWPTWVSCDSCCMPSPSYFLPCGDRSLPSSHCLNYTLVTAMPLLSPQHISLCSHCCLSGWRVTMSFWLQCLCGHTNCVTCSKPSPVYHPAHILSVNQATSCIQLAPCTIPRHSIKSCFTEDTSAPGGSIHAPLQWRRLSTSPRRQWLVSVPIAEHGPAATSL